MKKQLFTFLALLITGIVSAQVGIGTTTPSQALDVETNEAGGTAIDINNTGTGDPKINLQLNGTTTFSIGVDNDDADKLKIGTSAPETNTRVTIDNTGNVGVGTSTPDQSAVLDAFSTTKGFLPPRLTTTQRNAITNPATGLVVFNTTTGFIEVNVGTTIAPSWQVISPGATGATGATGAQGPTGLLTAGTTAGNTPYWNGTSWVVNSSNIFNNGGNIGIGTSSPSEKLDIESSDATKTALDINNTGGGDPKINFQLSGTPKFSIGIDNSDSDKFKIGTSALENDTRFTIDASGNVGIGTSSPNAPLQFANIAANRKIVLFDNGSGNQHQFTGLGINDAVFRYQADVTTTDHVFYAGTSTTTSNELMRIKGTGLVGIGTASPTTNLHVAGTFRLVDGNQSNGKVLTSDANGVATWQTASGGSLPAGTSGQTLRHNGTNWVANSNIFNNGTNVGIGTSSPIEFFEVKGAAQNDGGGLVLINNTKPSSGNHYPALRVLNDRGTHSYGTVAEFRVSNTTDNDRPAILFSKGGTNNNWSVGMGSAVLGDDNFGIGYRSTYPISGFQTIYLCIGTTGNVGIGTTSPGYKLTVNGQPGANGFTAFTNYSDSRLKTNITNLDTGALSKIMQLRPVSFQYNQKYLQLYPNSDLQKVHKGFIAQEIRKVFPEMVSEMAASPDSVQYLDLDVSHLQVYLVKAMQEQQAIIEAQKKENDAQKAEIDALKQNALKVAELENKMNALLLLLNNKEELTVKQD